MWNGKPSKKGTGFEQSLAPHQHWHIDVSYINISGTFHYLCSILDGFGFGLEPMLLIVASRNGTAGTHRCHL